MHDFLLAGIDIKGKSNGASGMKEWYRCSADEVLRELGTSSAGLNRKEVIRRRRQFGENRVTESRKDPPWKIFF